jgi:hypothetical protein
MNKPQTKEELEASGEMNKLFQDMDLTILSEISLILYKQASPFGTINTPVGQWVFINPMNKQWYSKKELQSLLDQQEKRHREEIESLRMKIQTKNSMTTSEAYQNLGYITAATELNQKIDKLCRPPLCCSECGYANGKHITGCSKLNY